MDAYEEIKNNPSDPVNSSEKKVQFSVENVRGSETGTVVEGVKENGRGSTQSETSTVEGGSERCIRDDETFLSRYFDKYYQRPQLPLKPLKHKSLSCTSLVQTIKGFSKKKYGAKSRISLQEKTYYKEEEPSTSEATASPIVPPREFVHKPQGTSNRSDLSSDFAVRDAHVTEQLEGSPNEEKNHGKEHKFRRFHSSDDLLETKSECAYLQNQPWYHFINPKEARSRLLDMHYNGCFLIRPASNPTSEFQHTLCAVFLNRLYHFRIRTMSNGQFSLDTEKERDKSFPTLLDLIKFHRDIPIVIRFPGGSVSIYLLRTPPK